MRARAPERTTRQALQAGLSVEGLTVAFGGIKAVSDVSLSATVGRLTGLIGPNGAGKTTLFNACSGLIRSASGTISLFGSDITHTNPATRARLGLGRTFQRMQLVNAMTVRRNVALGAECRLVGFNPLRGLVSHRERRRVDEATDSGLEICGITALADQVAGTLSTGQRRLLELARVLAGKFELLLLDEPSSGLDEEETERLGGILARIPVEHNVGILLVEHDMALVMAVCEHIFVLEFGHLIFEGSPSATQSSELVRAAYLGNESIATTR